MHDLSHSRRYSKRSAEVREQVQPRGWERQRCSPLKPVCPILGTSI